MSSILTTLEHFVYGSYNYLQRRKIGICRLERGTLTDPFFHRVFYVLDRYSQSPNNITIIIWYKDGYVECVRNLNYYFPRTWRGIRDMLIRHNTYISSNNNMDLYKPILCNRIDKKIILSASTDLNSFMLSECN